MTGYWAPVRIRLPRRRRCCRAARRRPCPRRLAARCVRQLPARLALPRLEEHHPHPGGAHRGHGRRRRAARSNRGSFVYRPLAHRAVVRASRSSLHQGLTLRQELIIAYGQVGPALAHPHPIHSAHRRHAHRASRDIEEKPHAVALSLRLRLESRFGKEDFGAYLSRNDMFRIPQSQ